MLENLKKEVLEANIELDRKGIVTYTWGNVSGLDDSGSIMAIKPSGIPYDVMTAQDIVLLDVETGNIVEGNNRPSSDTDTHIVLYRSFPNIKGICHTHSINAVAYAQSERSIPVMGTTHADYFAGDIPCTRALTREEVSERYEYNTGVVIVEKFRSMGINPIEIPGVLVSHHGPFAWGCSAAEAVHNAVVLETVAEISLKTFFLSMNLNPACLPDYILEKHYLRKHGKDAYYGQVSTERSGR